jgi:hypothetical protein
MHACAVVWVILDGAAPTLFAPVLCSRATYDASADEVTITMRIEDHLERGRSHERIAAYFGAVPSRQRRALDLTLHATNRRARH